MDQDSLQTLMKEVVKETVRPGVDSLCGSLAPVHPRDDPSRQSNAVEGVLWDSKR